jgi:hypothetical protein
MTVSPGLSYKTTTITAALRSDGLCATSPFDGATNGARFRAYGSMGLKSGL